MAADTLISPDSAHRITGMLLDGIFASEAIDSSGEVFDVDGADISDLEEGRGVANWEHRGDDAHGASGLDIVGKIVFARKIFSSEDCENDRQIQFWDKIKLPFVYGIVRLYDGAGHEGAKALAAQIRDHVANGEPILVRFSIEGSTLEKEGNRLKRTVARRVALTIKPCNRTCDSGVIADPNAPEGFKKEPEVKVKDALADIVEATKKSESVNPMYMKLGASTEVETSTPWIDGELAKSMVKAKIKEKILAKGEAEPVQKALSAAGGAGAAPSALTGHAALEREDIKRNIVNTAKAALRDYKPTEHGDFKKYLKHCLPEASDSFIDHFTNLVDDYKAKLRKDDPEVGEKLGGKKVKAPKEKKPKKKKPEGLTYLGQPIKPNPDMRQGQYDFDEKTGTLRAAEGTVKLWNPDTDTTYGKTSSGKTVAGQTFRDVWNSEAVRKQHDYAVRQWLRVHQAMKDGNLPGGVIATAVAFSQLSPNTPVPVHEMMYAYLLDSFRHHGLDIRDPKFGEGFEQMYDEAKAKYPRLPKAKYEALPKDKQIAHDIWVNEGRRSILIHHPYYGDWIRRDTSQGFPESSRDYFQHQINQLVTNKKTSKVTGRQAGERSAFMLPSNKFSNMAQYHTLHVAMQDLVARHGIDARSAAKELMDNKNASGSWEQRRKTALAAGRPDIGEFPGVSVPGLAPKTARFTYAMLGGGNVFVPDTHFSRHLFGLDKDKDPNTIDLVRDKVLWGEQNSDIASAMDRWYFNNHPAVQLMLEHPEFGEYFRANPEQAIFPAFWGHWLSISGHEDALGHKMAGVASNQSASHRPIFEEIGHQLGDPLIRPNVFGRVQKSESDPVGGSLIHPIHAAYLLRDWTQQLGPAHASFRFFTHLLPLLWPEHQPQVETLNVPQLVRKMQALEVDLKKALAERTAPEVPSAKEEQKAAPQWDDGPTTFAGQDIQKPGLVHLFDSNKMASVLHVSKDHVIAVPNEKLRTYTPEDIMKLPRRDEGKSFDIHEMPRAKTTVVDASIHGIPYYNTTAEQHTLIHGLDTSGAEDTPSHVMRSTTRPLWMKNPQGKLLIVKRSNALHGPSYVRSEVLYHNMARDFFGLGHYVPTTAIFRNPKTSEEYSAQEMVPGAEHAEPYEAKNDRQAQILMNLHDTGEMDKIRVMNVVLGNSDRHHGNFVFTEDGEPNIRLIDHGFAFRDWGLDDYPGYVEMHEREHFDRNPQVRTNKALEPARQPIHPAAAAWLQSLNPEKLEQQLLAGKLEPWRARVARRTLEQLQTHVKQGLPRSGVFNMLPGREDEEG